MTGKRAETVEKPTAAEISDSSLRRLLGYQIRRASNVIQADLAATLAEFDLRMITYTALVLIVDNPGLSQSQLAKAIDMERPNLVVIMDELERRGLIERTQALSDRRAYALHARKAGRMLCERAAKAVATHEKRLFDILGPDLRKTVAEAMELIQSQKGRMA